MTSEVSELASCPFCGGDADFVGGERKGYIVQCKSCLSQGAWGDYGYQAEAAWNRRAEARQEPFHPAAVTDFEISCALEYLRESTMKVPSGIITSAIAKIEASLAAGAALDEAEQKKWFDAGWEKAKLLLKPEDLASTRPAEPSAREALQAIADLPYESEGLTAGHEEAYRAVENLFDTPPSIEAHPAETAVKLPDDNDGVEQDAFEEWAGSEKYDMQQHPLHWLFLNKETAAARKGWRAGIRHARDRIRSALLPAGEAEAWRCFHCDEVFTDERSARLHFGADEGQTPACQIKGSEGGLVEALRRAEKDAADAWFAIHNETTDAAKGFYAQAARHQEQLRAVEQVGYDRGIADAKAHPETIGLYATLPGVVEALRRIAEGNLGDEPWQANYARIKQVAAEALASIDEVKGDE